MNKDLAEKYISTTTQPLDEFHKRGLLNLLSDNNVSHTLKSNILLFLRKHRDEINPKELAKYLGIDQTSAKDLLNNKVIEAFFPVAEKGRQKITKLLVIELQSTTFSFKKGIQNELKLVVKLTGKNFFVGFIQDFSGKSFLLALSSALICKKSEKLKDYAFTGDLNFDGKVIDVDFLKEKMEATGQKKLIHPGIVKDLKELGILLNSDTINIPFSIALKQSKKDLTPKEASLTNLYQITQNTDFELTKRLYGLKDDDFIFYTDDKFLPKDNWESILKSAYEKIVRLKEKLKDKTCILHLCLLGPATFSFGLGAMVGCKEPFVVYHYTSGKFKVVLDFSKRNLRLLKSFNKKPGHIECKKDADAQETDILAISIYAASHNPRGDIRKFLKNNFENYILASCEAKDKGNLEENDWAVYVNEIYLHYNKLKEITTNKRLMFFACPVPLAFGLGVAIETFDDIEVYNFEPLETSYFKVFNLANLKV